MPDLAKEISEFCRNVMGRPCKRIDLINEMVNMAQHNPAWPTARCSEWEAAIETACKRGLLVRTSETIWIPAVVESVKPKQGELF